MFFKTQIKHGKMKLQMKVQSSDVILTSLKGCGVPLFKKRTGFYKKNARTDNFWLNSDCLSTEAEFRYHSLLK
jgi:hypothetical protein